jgi:hypothetical protein
MGGSAVSIADGPASPVARAEVGETSAIDGVALKNKCWPEMIDTKMFIIRANCFFD